MRDTAAAAAKASAVADERLTIAAPDHVVLSVKKAALRRCLTNLVDNALKASRHVAVTLTRGERHAVDRGGR